MLYQIRGVEEDDIENGGLLDVLENVAAVGPLSKSSAKDILKQIHSNPLHRIFVAILQEKKNSGLVIGSITLLVEPKLILTGGRVGHIEDVAVRKEYQHRGIGANLVKYATEQAASMGCVRTILDCSKENVPFYEKLVTLFSGIA